MAAEGRRYQQHPQAAAYQSYPQVRLHSPYPQAHQQFPQAQNGHGYAIPIHCIHNQPYLALDRGALSDAKHIMQLLCNAVYPVKLELAFVSATSQALCCKVILAFW